ncbi:hypothetical protein T265_13091, partial [Opisthorchis viverrini]
MALCNIHEEIREEQMEWCSILGPYIPLAVLGIVLSEQAEASLLDWMPVDSRLCAVRLATSVRESRESEVHRTLFIVSAYTPIDCSSESAKDSIYKAVLGIVLSEQAEASLLDWMPVDSRLCAVRLATSVRESRESEVHRTLFIVSAYTPIDCSSESAKDSIYKVLGALLQQAKSSDIVVLASDMNVKRCRGLIGWSSWFGHEKHGHRRPVTSNVCRSQTIPLQYEFPEQRTSLDNLVPTNKPAPNPHRPHRRQLSVAR